MIYLLRHGQTVWNAERRFQGRLDSPLTPLGIAQAQSLGRLLGGLLDRPDAFRFVASPQGRAWQTAVIVAGELGLSPKVIAHEPRLMEQDYGIWQGQTVDEITATEEDRWTWYRADRWHRGPPEGESYSEVTERVSAWLATVSESDRVIAVCHGVVSRVMRGVYGGLAPEQVFALPEPQDKLYRLSGGRIEPLTAAFVDG